VSTEQLLPVALLVLALALVANALVLVRRRELIRPRGAGPDRAANDDARSPAPADVEQLQQIADALQIGLVRIDGRGRIVLANEASHRYLGRQPGGLVGKTTMEAFVDHRIADLTRAARRSGSAHLELVSAGEPQLTLTVRARRLPDRAGLWVVLEDVSELKRLRRIRAEFIDNLSHELRTPLTTVRLLTETLALELDRTPLPPRIRDSIVKIDVETGHLVQMVNELLDLAKIEQGEAPLRLEDVDLGRIVEATLDRLRLYAERQGVRLRGEMPGLAADRTIRGDEERLGQLLINLVHNAVKFSPQGGDVVVRLRPNSAELLLEVQDHGVGIAREDLDRIFERFYKVDRARAREGGGTGLGLAIARHIVERHGGRIWAESEEGKGSLFHVALPR
jgi:two-component system, OmpR family, phosphate regulon sensor histidine kinase PhoR